MRAFRPVHRSVRRSRRRQTALACAMLSYLAAFAAGVLALLSLVAPTGHPAVVAAVASGGVGLAGLLIWVMDLWLEARAPRLHHRLG